MDDKLLGKCGFYCGACPTYLSENCKGCTEEHEKGDCFSHDCVIEKGLDFCGQCSSFPCDYPIRAKTREKDTYIEFSMAESLENRGKLRMLIDKFQFVCMVNLNCILAIFP